MERGKRASERICEKASDARRRSETERDARIKARERRAKPVVVSSRSIRTLDMKRGARSVNEDPCGNATARERERQGEGRGRERKRKRRRDGREKERGEVRRSEWHGKESEEEKGGEDIAGLFLVSTHDPPALSSLSFFHLSRAECLGS